MSFKNSNSDLFFIQPLVLTSTPKPIKLSTEASKRTLRNRSKFLKHHLQTASGNSTEAIMLQTGTLIKNFDSEERQKILATANINPVEISADAMVAMKSDLGIPWEKLKTMTR